MANKGLMPPNDRIMVGFLFLSLFLRLLFLLTCISLKINIVFIMKKLTSMFRHKYSLRILAY